MKSIKYILILLLAFGCNNKEFDNPFDPLAKKDYKIEVGYSGSGLSQLKIDNSNIEERSFKCYEVYFSLIEDFTPDAENLFIRITDWDSTSISISSLDENETYYFIVKFVDVLDRTVSSEKINVLTGNKVPAKPLFSASTKVELNQIEFVWYATNIKDFQKYELYFSELKNFPITQLNLHRTTTNISDTSFVIGNLRPNTEYYYRLRTYDKGNLYSDSDEEHIKTGNDIPTQVTIERISDETDSSVVIHWSKNEDIDFLRYEIHYSTTQNFVVSPSTLYGGIGITDQNTTSYTISNLTALTKYYFKVRVVDNENAFMDSEEVSVTTKEPMGPDIPTPVTILEPTDADITQTSVTIRWAAYQDPEFKGYQVHYSTDANFMPSPTTLHFGTLPLMTTNSWTVTGLRSSTTYYFTVRVINVKDKFSDSKRVSATTK
jgi:hypothetical protein